MSLIPMFVGAVEVPVTSTPISFTAGVGAPYYGYAPIYGFGSGFSSGPLLSAAGSTVIYMRNFNSRVFLTVEFSEDVAALAVANFTSLQISSIGTFSLSSIETDTGPQYLSWNLPNSQTIFTSGQSYTAQLI